MSASGWKDRLRHYVQTHQRSILLLVVGLGMAVVMVVGAFWLYDLIVAPPVPDPEAASAEEVLAFMAHPQGLSRLPMEERKACLIEIMQHYAAPERRAELGRAFEKMPPDERDRVREAVFTILKDQVMKDADQYRRLSPEQRERFVLQRIGEYDKFRRYFRRSGPSDKPLARSFAQGLPTRSDEWIRLLLFHTTAEEQAKAREYFDHIAQVVDRMKKQQRRRG